MNDVRRLGVKECIKLHVAQWHYPEEKMGLTCSDTFGLSITLLSLSFFVSIHPIVFRPVLLVFVVLSRVGSRRVWLVCNLPQYIVVVRIECLQTWPLITKDEESYPPKL